MSNAIYISCLECNRLMQGPNSELECPNCHKKVCMDDGSDFADCGYLKTDEFHTNHECDCESEE